jgi:hypothetical protein
MSKSNFNKVHIKDEDLPYQLREEVELVDFSEQMKPNKDGSPRIVMSESVKYGKETLWKAINNKGEIYWTNSKKSPQIINTHTGRGRGNIAFTNGDVAKLGGRPAGAKNRISAKTVCDNLNIHPAEYAAAILTSDPALCRKYGIKDIKEITIKNKEAAMKELYNRMEGQAKAQQLDKYGDVVEDVQDSEKDVTNAFQIYIPKASDEVKDE